jgi:hypothetical protein
VRRLSRQSVREWTRMSGKFLLFYLNFIAMYQLKLSHCIISKNGLFGLTLERGV